MSISDLPLQVWWQTVPHIGNSAESAYSWKCSKVCTRSVLLTEARTILLLSLCSLSTQTNEQNTTDDGQTKKAKAKVKERCAAAVTVQSSRKGNVWDQRLQQVFIEILKPRQLSAQTCLFPLHLGLAAAISETRGQSNLTKSASRGAHSPVMGHPRRSKVVPLNSWGRVSY